MSYGLLGTLLLLLPGPTSAEGRHVQQSPGQLWVLPEQTAELSCRVLDHSQYVNWYKERPDGSLYWIYRNLNYPSPGGKYSGRSETRGSFSFTISSMQREDSGVYYCSSSNFYTLFGDGTRLVVTNASEPKLSILVPIDAEEPGQPLASIPLLCHLHDLPPGWDTVRWQPGGEVTPVTAATMDKHGVLSAWSITWVLAKQWDGAVACMALENSTGKTIIVAITKGPREEARPSWPLALGLSCVSLLFLLQLTILLCRRHLARDGSMPARPLPRSAKTPDRKCIKTQEKWENCESLCDGSRAGTAPCWPQLTNLCHQVANLPCEWLANLQELCKSQEKFFGGVFSDRIRAPAPGKFPSDIS